jgi:hypothetical protein
LRSPTTWLLVLSGVLAGFGCVHARDFIPLNRAALRASKPTRIKVTNPPPANFDGEAFKNSFLLGGLIGMGLSQAIGVSGDGINDPALKIRFELVLALARRFDLQVVEAGAPDTHLVLDVRTLDWGIVPTRFEHYGAKYSGILRLLDLRTNQVLAQSTCSGTPIDEPDNPTLEAMEHGGAALLKAMLTEAARYCLEDFRKRTLGLYQ